MLCVWDDSGPLRRWHLPIGDMERPAIIFGMSGSGMEDMGIAGVHYDLETWLVCDGGREDSRLLTHSVF
jgi:hypothetical protein